MNTKGYIRTWILLLDLGCISAALVFARYAHTVHSFGAVFSRPIILDWLPFLVAAISFWAILYSVLHLDGFSGGWHLPTMVSQVSLSVMVFTLFLLAFAFLAHEPYSRVVIVYFAVLSFVGFVGVRTLSSIFLRSTSRRNAVRRTVILGNGNIARELARKIARHPELMCEVIGFLFPGNGDPVAPANGPATVGSSSVPTLEIVDLLRAQKADELVIALPDGSSSELMKLVALCRSANIRISLVPQWYELYVLKARFVEIDGLPMVSLVEREPSATSAAIKRATDISLAVVFLLLASPILLVATLMLKMRRRKAVVRELRCGREGRIFQMYRLNIDRDRHSELRGLERALVVSSLTELPQLLNVLRGEMSLVGPRPERVERVQRYSDWQRQRLSVCPGVTGLAQVHGLRDEASSEEKARFDVQYIYQRSLFLDLVIIVQTCWTIAIRFLPTRNSARPSGESAPFAGASAPEV